MVQTASTMSELGSCAANFSLPNTNPNFPAEQVSLADFQDAKALLVVFACNHCPFVVHIREQLVALVKSYQSKGMACVVISANDVASYPQDGPDKMREDSLKHGYTFPYLYDQSQDVAKAYEAACTPDFFLYDNDRRLVYRGQFDGSRPGNQLPVTGADLRNAVDCVLAGKAVSGQQIPSIGCNIKWRD